MFVKGNISQSNLIFVVKLELTCQSKLFNLPGRVSSCSLAGVNVLKLFFFVTNALDK